MKKRITLLQRVLKQENLDCLLVTDLPQIHYLCGYTGTNGLLIVFQTEAIFITDFRYAGQVRQQVKGAKIKVVSRELLSELDENKKLQTRNLRVGYLEQFLPVQSLKMIKAKLPNALMAPTFGLVEALAVKKDAGELKLLKKAAEITDTAFERVLQIIRPGVGENEVRAELEYQMMMLGSEKPGFETIIASGPRSAMPHGVASEKKIKKGEFVTLDFGAVYEGYHADMTRTVVVGKANSKQKKIYNLVLKAQIAGIKKAKAGLKGSEVDKHVRDIITRAGYGKNFGHGLGHGLGLQIHEEPRLTPLSDTVLEPNMVVTVEPGIYLDGWGGVRIEDDIIITRNGCRVINKSDKSLIEL